MLRGERKRRKYGVFRIGGTEAQRPQFYWRTGRTGGDNPDTEGCVVGALCEKYAQQQFYGGRGAGAYRPDSRMRDYGSAFVEKAPLVILVMGDQLRSDLWEVNAAISATYVQLAAQALELGSCWVHVAGRPRRREEPGGPAAEDYLRSFLPVPESRRILCAVAIGHTAEPALSERRRYPTRMTGSSSCRETFFVGSGVGTFRRRTFSRNAAESFPSLDIMDYGE